MSNKYYISDSRKMAERKILAEEFYNSILDPEEIPYIVIDEASLYDFFAGDEQELINKVIEKYGVSIDLQQFKITFWQLFDYINKKRKNE